MPLGCRRDEDLLPAHPGKEASPGHGVNERQGKGCLFHSKAPGLVSHGQLSPFLLWSLLLAATSPVSPSIPRRFSFSALEASLASACHLSWACLQAGLLLPELLQRQSASAVTEPAAQLPGGPDVTRWVTARLQFPLGRASV